MLQARGVLISFIGERAQLAPDIVALIGQAEQQTYNNTELNLIVALNYGGRSEITAAARALARDVANGRRRPEDIDEAVFQSHLSTAGVPDPDVVIRTSGEKRISNFLLWQSAYAELVFIDTLWPDFGKQDFENALHEFHRRERRYGAAGG